MANGFPRAAVQKTSGPSANGNGRPAVFPEGLEGWNSITGKNFMRLESATPSLSAATPILHRARTGKKALRENLHRTQFRLLASSSLPMSQKFLPRLLAALFVLSSALAFTGCASKDEIAAKRRWETDDERATREVFRENWLLPSVSNEDKDFFYRPFWKRD